MKLNDISFIGNWKAKALLDEGKENNCDGDMEDSKPYPNIQNCITKQIVPHIFLVNYVLKG